jgi:hypothetical protein
LILSWFDKALLGVADGFIQVLRYKAQRFEAAIVGGCASQQPWFDKSFPDYV